MKSYVREGDIRPSWPKSLSAANWETGKPPDVRNCTLISQMLAMHGEAHPHYLTRHEKIRNGDAFSDFDWRALCERESENAFRPVPEPIDLDDLESPSADTLDLETLAA